MDKMNNKNGFRINGHAVVKYIDIKIALFCGCDKLMDICRGQFDFSFMFHLNTLPSVFPCIMPSSFLKINL